MTPVEQTVETLEQRHKRQIADVRSDDEFERAAEKSRTALIKAVAHDYAALLTRVHPESHAAVHFLAASGLSENLHQVARGYALALKHNNLVKKGGK